MFDFVDVAYRTEKLLNHLVEYQMSKAQSVKTGRVPHFALFRNLPEGDRLTTRP
jgi:hypothetical protein